MSTGGCKCRTISFKRNLKIEVNVAVSDVIYTVSLIKFYVIIFVHFILGEVF